MGFGVGEMSRMTSTTNDVTTLASNFLLECDPSLLVTVELITGQVFPGPPATRERSLLTFTAFHYNVTKGRSTAWSFYRDANWTAGANGLDPLPFEASGLIRGDATWNSATHEVTIPIGGNYYVYVSGGTQPNRPLGLTVQRNGNDLFGVYRTATNWDGVDTLSYGAVIVLNAGDRLKVVAEPNTAGYSGSALRHTSFFGFLII